MHTYAGLGLLLFVLSLISIAYGGCEVDPSFPGFNPNVYKYETSDTVTDVDIDDVTPPINTPPGASAYLGIYSCLGYYGPLGPYGPLGSLGPIGSNTWSPSYWISGTGLDWTDYSEEISGLGGPLSASGPLSSVGPLSPTAYYDTMPCINDFSANLAAGGLWTVLGPLGPMGPAGALGPLGPIGAHGYATDSHGQFIDATGTPVRSISAPWDSTTSRTWDLFERYTKSFATSFTAHDCSFMVEGVVSPGGDTYSFTSSVAQYVTILLVPLKQLDDWILTVKDSTGHKIATIGPDLYINWMQIRVKANTKLTAQIKLGSSFQPLPSDYRLYVSGSTSYIDGTDIQGPHLKTYTPV